VVVADGGFRLELDAPAYGVAAGQAAVLYEGDAVVGAGTIVPNPSETLCGPRAFEPTGE
jgi:tRNA U34 2-thiouridine synthase MnmA/TrmU